MIAFDLTNDKSFENLDEFYNYALNRSPSNVKIALIGTKADLDTDRKVSYEDAMKYATEKSIQYFEVSAKTGFNVDLMLQTVVDDYFENNE